MGRLEMLGKIVQRDESINGGDESVNVILVECGEERKEIVGATSFGFPDFSLNVMYDEHISVIKVDMWPSF